MAKLAYLFDPQFLEHNPGSGHPEHAGRLRAIEAYLQQKGLFNKLTRFNCKSATAEQLNSIHDTDYIDRVLSVAGQDGIVLDGGDTRLGAGSVEAALLAAGAAITAVDLVFEQDFDKVFAAVRPPGHHARPATAMGFCVFNNIALAAAYARQKGYAQKVLIIDWDVHHGNGTQEIFEADANVFYLSLHQYPFYPLTGRSNETGKGKGKGYTLNVPLMAGSDDAVFLEAFENALARVEQSFKADLVLISAGFDGHTDDPIGGLRLSDEGYYKLTEITARLAQRQANGRIISFLEGGYDTQALARSTYRHLQCLLKH